MLAEVTSIDMDNITATLNLGLRPRQPFPNIGLVGQIFGGVAVDGGGWIFVNGQFIPIPRRGPVTDLVQQVARYLGVQTYQTGVESALGSQRAALEDVVRSVVALYREASAISEQPPGYGAQNLKEKNRCVPVKWIRWRVAYSAAPGVPIKVERRVRCL